MPTVLAVALLGYVLPLSHRSNPPGALVPAVAEHDATTPPRKLVPAVATRCAPAIAMARWKFWKASAAESAPAAAAAASPTPPPTPPPTSGVARVDALRELLQYDEALAALQELDRDDLPVAWRLARAHLDLSEEAPKESAERERYIRDGLAIVDEAARAKWADSGEIFKWHGCLLGALSDFVGTKEKVTNALIVRESLERAAPLLPDDATVQTALGQWCTKVASMNVLQRNAAKLLFGPLEATHEEALAYYTRANELRTEKRVLIKLAETHLALSQRGDAKAWAERAAELPSKPGGAEDDLDAKIAAVLGAC